MNHRAKLQLETEIAALQREHSIITQKLCFAREGLRELKAQEFIEANQLKIEDIELSQGDEKPWFGHIDNFVDWLKLNSKKKYAEWNTRVHLTSDLLTGGKTEPEIYLEDLKK